MWRIQFVILNPSPVTLSPSPAVILSEAKDLDFRLRINSVKNRRESISYKTEILRLTPSE